MIAGRLGAGVLLGFLLACALGGIVTLLGPGPAVDNATWAVLLMPLLWIGIAAGAVAFTEAWRAWLWLGCATLLAFAALWALKLGGFLELLEAV